LIKKADDYFKQYKYSEAARLYETAAESAIDTSQKIALYKKAAEAYHELGSTDEEARCLVYASNLLDGEEKIDCLVLCWKAYITAIAVFQYDTSFEWKGEDENLNASYSETIDDYLGKAVGVLEKVLEVKGVDKSKLIEELGTECVKRQNEGGWGASYCWKSIEKAWKRTI
jgi:hypothetical protein